MKILLSAGLVVAAIAPTAAMGIERFEPEDDAYAACKTVILYEAATTFSKPIKAIKFGKIENHKIHMVVDIDIETKNGMCAAGMNLWLPLQFYFRAGVYSDDFEGLSSAERFTEIKQCFLDYYNIEDYDLEERVINADKKEVMTRFVLKSSAS